MEITMYGTKWCGNSLLIKEYLKKQHIKVTWYDIESNSEARKYVELVNKGNRSVPTIVFPDGSILVEPSFAALEKKLVEIQII